MERMWKGHIIWREINVEKYGIEDAEKRLVLHHGRSAKR